MKNNMQEIADKETKRLLSAINEFCKNVDPTKYVLCQKLDFVDGSNRFWFEAKEQKGVKTKWIKRKLNKK